MSKFRSLILIIGLTIIAVAAALLTVLVLYATGTIVTDPIELVYIVDSKSKDYDGTPLTLADDAYSLVSGEILEGHTAQVKIIGSQTDAGESESTLEVKIVDKNGFDVSKGYAVKVNTGTLTVKQKNISVSIPGGQEVPYNGKEIFFNEYDVLEGSLVKGHKIGGTNASGINVGELSVDVQPIIYDAFDNDVTENYKINFEAGKVKIVQRTLTIQPKNFTKVYDGEEYVATELEITEGSLATGHTVTCDILKSSDDGDPIFTDYTGEYGERIKISNFQIKDEDGNLVDLDNYDYTINAGTVKIEQRPLTIKTATNQSFIYNGEAQYDDTYQILSGSLAPKQKLTVATHTTVTEVKQGVPNKLTYEFTLDDEEETPVLDTNYKITPIEGTLSVQPFDLTVYTKSYTKTYEKDETLGKVIDEDTTNYWLSVKLPEKFTLTAECPKDVKDKVDATDKTYYRLEEVVIYIGDDPCTQNFNINVVDGTYEITKKAVEIKLKTDLEDTYTGKKYEFKNEKVFENFDFSECKGVTADDFNVYCLYDIKTAGTHYYTAEYTGTDKDNYDFTFVSGVINIKKKAVTLAYTGDEVKIDYIRSSGYDYDDENITEGLSIDIGEGVNCTVKSAKFFILINGTTEKITVKSESVVVLNEEDEDITTSLDIDYSKVNIPFEVNKRSFEFKFTPYSAYSVSDNASELIPCVYTVGLDSGDTLKVETINYGGGDTYKVGTYDIVDKDGNSVKKYYECKNESATGAINFIVWG